MANFGTFVANYFPFDTRNNEDPKSEGVDESEKDRSLQSYDILEIVVKKCQFKVRHHAQEAGIGKSFYLMNAVLTD